MTFRNYQDGDNERIHEFLIRVNRVGGHMNWNWARYEWMFGHSFFDASLVDKIGLWFDGEELVGLAVFDMYLGECACIVTKEYENLYEEIADYSWKAISDDDGLGIYVNDTNIDEIDALLRKDFIKQNEHETVLCRDLSLCKPALLPEGYSFKAVDPYVELKEISWLFYQGFDHGDDYAEFLKETSLEETPRRPHFNPYLNITCVREDGVYVGFIGGWYEPTTDYLYLEPLCVIPSARGKGIASALINELLFRAKSLGAKRAIVLSDMPFYQKRGFLPIERHTLYCRRKRILVDDVPYAVVRLLGKGKGGYSYLTQKDDAQVVVKQIHHEPCAYYSFGDKLAAERNDYERLTKAGIRMPRLLEVDESNERIVKEYIEGPTIFDMVLKDEDASAYVPQVRQMAALAKDAGLNIDYFPTNFVVKDGVLYYVDYECNDYMDEWSFERWGIRYWSKTPEFLEHVKKK